MIAKTDEGWRGAFFCLVLLALFFAPISRAHDFWLQPDRFDLAAPGTVGVNVFVGHAGEVNDWPRAPERVISLRLYRDGQIIDRQAILNTAPRNGPLPIDIEEPGLTIVGMETIHAVSRLEAEKFNTYVKNEGITTIAFDRTQRRMMDTEGTEIYSRRGKALIQVGDEIDPEAGTRPLGFTLEITPQKNPYAINSGDPVPFLVTYRGEPLSGATVKLIRLGSEDEMAVVTGNDGTASVPRPEEGGYILHTVWSSPTKTEKRADYDTTFSSISFGFVPD